ncbi:AI-2E family transporter [Sulfitobacter sp. KE29]|nr:AI-2E family transporter [Sulfitobacter sp. HI0054]MBO9439399.1 AI-2E family transporter [Sulfitobacter sp. R18_2]MDF3416859.1 AI-2E family transporter [Sulfitobacter sp. Ks38]MDF3424341.1 AI-2E family transporter [Sulfitobacter sp. KE29]MDF3427921.1 AI-2E family transporter [Sulfitobacter sp. S46]MDF3442693.1 AI-2E family transporter [Sulfitobacter sp. KE31]MDF3546719.1 AI-2E family transporter [Sulfitobacter sp. KE28]TKA85732.1 AI-2E family transporter [Sulfitobacter sp. 15WGC]
MRRASGGKTLNDIAAIRRLLEVLVLIALFVTAYFAKDLLLPILLGFLLALTLSPLIRSFEKFGISAPLGAVLLIGCVGLIIFVLAGLSAGTVATWSDEIPTMGNEIRRKLQGWAQTVEDVRSATEQVEQIGTENGSGRPEEVVVKQPGLLDNAMNTGARIGGTVAVALVLALFLLASGDLFYLKLVQSFQTFTGKKRALKAVYDVERRVSRYLLTITIINAGLGISVGLYLFALGLPVPYVWGLAAFLLNFLPYIGGVIGAVLVGAYAIATFDSVGYAILAPLGYQILTGIEGQFITPYLVGRRLELNTVAVFLTVVFWGWLWGIAGALVAVPFLVVFKVICENVTALNMIGHFLDKSAPDVAATAADEPAAEKPGG